jgi:hypothetical protein
MDGIASLQTQGDSETKKNVIVIGATNRPWDLDDALKRRLERRICLFDLINFRYPSADKKRKRRTFQNKFEGSLSLRKY